MPGRRSVTGAGHRLWAVGCGALVAALLLVRWLRYADAVRGTVLEAPLRALMVLDVQAFVWPWVYTTLKLPIVVAMLLVLALGLHRRLPSRLVTRVDGRWRLRPAVTSIALAALVWFHYLFDLNVTIAKVCASSLGLWWIVARSPLRSVVGPWLRRGLWLALFGGWLVLAPDVADRLTIVVWAGTLLAVERFVAPRVGDGEATLLRIGAVLPMNLLPAVLPLVLPLHDGRRLGDGLAYGFCEVPGRGTVFATIPVCDSVRAGFEDCRDGRVVEYDRRSLQPVATRRYFSPSFHGRLELVECLDDEVQAAVQASVIRGRPVLQSTLAFPASNPDVFTPAAAGEGVGITIAFDRQRDALFYTGEYTHRVVRVDRRTQSAEDVGGADLARRWYQPVTLDEHTGSSILYTHSIHPGRNRIYLAEWMRGRHAYAIDLDTRRVVERYDVGGGGALGIMVDPERDRLWVSSVWGFDVFDLGTGAVIHRQRVGTGNRSAVLDRARGRVYLPSTVEGKIRVFDRDSFALVGQIPIGIGTRFPYLSADEQTLFGSSVAAHYAWDADGLAGGR